MGNEFSNLTHENRRSIICYLTVNLHCQQALLEIVHNSNYGLPTNEEDLFKFFDKKENRKIIKDLQKKNVLKDDQVNLLLPQNQRTFSKKWDVTLICVVIINFTKLPPPKNGWKKELDPTDVTVAAFVVMARRSRNMMNHATLATFIDNAEFNAFFTDMRAIVVGLNYSQISKFDELTIETFNVVSFMNEFKDSKEKKNFISEALGWLKNENEKGLLILI